jgi:PII-like signaling protein
MPMHGFKGERTLMRIFIGESDRCAEGPHRGKPLHDALVRMLRERGCAGATVLRAIQGFGASARVHTAKLLELSLNLPIVVEVVETEEKIQELLPVLDTMIGGGMVTLERVRVILYRPGDFAAGDRWAHRIEGLEPADAPGDQPEA